jgi:hypothetical protein
MSNCCGIIGFRTRQAYAKINTMDFPLFILSLLCIGLNCEKNLHEKNVVSVHIIIKNYSMTTTGSLFAKNV